jgi:hypothetical protein
VSKINKITKIFTKTIAALVKEGDKLQAEAISFSEIAHKAAQKGEEARTESKRAFKIAAKIEGVLN